MQTAYSKKPLGFFSLVMINVMAVDSLRSLPIAAQFGLAVPFFYTVVALFFFIPSALITAEMATTFPNTGGVYIWVRNAFGPRWGWFTIWLQWIYNVVWYPTMLAFILAALTYLIDPHLIQNKTFVLSLMLMLWWLVTGMSCLGIRASSRVSTFGALVGTLIPMLFIIGFAAYSVLHTQTCALTFSKAAFFPSLRDSHHLAFLTTVVFGLMGLEMSAVHAGDVQQPQKNYPRALFCSVPIILGTLMLGALAIASIVPSGQLNILSGLIAGYALFLNHYHLDFLMPILIICIVLGSLCSVSTWVMGPTRGLLIASAESQLPYLKWLLKQNRFDAPVNVLLFQGVLVSLLTGLLLLVPSVKEAYWLLSVMTAQLALLFYILLFLTAFRLRGQYPTRAPGAYRLPGGKVGMGLVTLLGLTTCLTTFILGFLAPEVTESVRWRGWLIFGVVVLCFIPYAVMYFCPQQIQRRE
ncbi:amino acid permease [Rickettsiella massiliensis]|uniref:amino acid permease n=1 Tax=Rickettsiella massiliensis TaxID=676517 RepID=UPI000299F632|nr:amino acid permease [Rickettsiella massiliensis]